MLEDSDEAEHVLVDGILGAFTGAGGGDDDSEPGAGLAGAEGLPVGCGLDAGELEEHDRHERLRRRLGDVFLPVPRVGQHRCQAVPDGGADRGEVREHAASRRRGGAGRREGRCAAECLRDIGPRRRELRRRD